MLLCLPFSGCGHRGISGPASLFRDQEGNVTEVPKLTLLMDSISLAPENLRTYFNMASRDGRDFCVELEKVHTTGSEPEARLTKLRVEMMAGEGPDLILEDCFTPYIRYEGSVITKETPMFKFPEAAMRNHIFLPLDNYLDQAQFMEWDKLAPAIMEAGRNEEGKILMPTMYRLPVLGVECSLLDLPEELPVTPEEMAASGNAVLEFASFPEPMEVLGYFGVPADYEKEELTFTEDEYVELWQKLLKHRQASRSSYYAPVINNGRFHENVLSGFSENVKLWGSGRQDYIVIPQRDREGKVAATITGFLAVNANTPYPEEAFRVVDALLGREAMKDRAIYVNGTTVYMDAQQEPPQVQALWDEIESVRFFSALEGEDYQQVEWLAYKQETTPEDIEKAARNAYSTMKMMLAES